MWVSRKEYGFMRERLESLEHRCYLMREELTNLKCETSLETTHFGMFSGTTQMKIGPAVDGLLKTIDAKTIRIPVDSVDEDGDSSYVWLTLPEIIHAITAHCGIVFEGEKTIPASVKKVKKK